MDDQAYVYVSRLIDFYIIIFTPRQPQRTNGRRRTRCPLLRAHDEMNSVRKRDESGPAAGHVFAPHCSDTIADAVVRGRLATIGRQVVFILKRTPERLQVKVVTAVVRRSSARARWRYRRDVSVRFFPHETYPSVTRYGDTVRWQNDHFARRPRVEKRGLGRLRRGYTGRSYTKYFVRGRGGARARLR